MRLLARPCVPVRKRIRFLLDDSRRYADLVHAQGGWCEVHVWEGMVHVFQSNFELLRAGKESLKAISEFLEHQLHTKQKVST